MNAFLFRWLPLQDSNRYEGKIYIFIKYYYGASKAFHCCRTSFVSIHITEISPIGPAYLSTLILYIRHVFRGKFSHL